MRTKSEIEAILLKQYLKESNIATHAYLYWKDEDMPDGEAVGHMGIKNKDRHWLMAHVSLETLAALDADIIYIGQLTNEEWAVKYIDYLLTQEM